MGAKKRTFLGKIGPIGFLLLIFFYFLLIALILIFSQQILLNIQDLNPFTNNLVIVVMIIFPLILAGIIVFNILRLIRERANNNPGARLKTKLVLFFAAIALLSLIPISLLSISFINSSISFWFNVNILPVLDGGLKVSVQYYLDKKSNLDVFCKSQYLKSSLIDANGNFDRFAESIMNVNNDINFIQVFDRQGAVRFFYSKNNLSSEEFDDVNGKSGLLPRKEKGDFTLLRYVIPFRASLEPLTFVFGVSFLKEFNEYATQITSSRNIFRQLDQFKDEYNIVVIFFYFFFAFPIFLLSILISFLLIDEIIKPIVQLGEATKRVAEGDFSFRVLSRGHDDLAVLVDSFNLMVSELYSSRHKLLQTEKISTWQDIARRLAHEIKNPLTPIKLSAQRIVKKFEGNAPNFQNILENGIKAIIREVENLDSMLNEFGEFARLPQPKFQKVDIKKVIIEVTEMYQNLSTSVKFHVIQIDDNVQIFCDLTQIKQIFANLFKNAIQAMPDGGEIDIQGSHVTKGALEYFRLQIHDTGYGIAEEDIPNIFVPYFTTKENGTGLGLAIVERIIFDHNGNIWVESEKGVGTTFYLDLPIGVDNESNFDH
ncbi:MAG: HAMP domain-containing protein [Spirochaetales bacterium]|nr:HAMP domain-containing protein [Spirochaetales bacterium]